MFRFAIKDLLWLTLVSAVLVGAWLDRRHLAGDNARLRDELKSNEQLTTMLYSAVNRVGPISAGSVKALEPIGQQKARETFFVKLDEGP